MSQAIENRLDNAYLIADCIVKVSGQNVSNDIMDKVMLGSAAKPVSARYVYYPRL